MAATLDGKILELRLVTKESTIGGASVFRIAKSLREYNAALTQDPVDQHMVLAAHENFSRDVLLYELEISKASKTMQLCDNEIANFKLQEEDIENKIQSTRSTLLALEEELKLQQSIRILTEECEVKAGIVNDLPTPNNLKRQIEECDATLQNLASSLDSVEVKLNKRVKQYESLLQSIQILSDPLVDAECIGIGVQGEDDADRDEEGDEEDIDGKREPDLERRKSRGALDFSKSEEPEEGDEEEVTVREEMEPASEREESSS